MALLDTDWDERPQKWHEGSFGSGLRPSLKHKRDEKSRLRHLLEADRNNRPPAPITLPKLSILRDET